MVKLAQENFRQHQEFEQERLQRVENAKQAGRFDVDLVIHSQLPNGAWLKSMKETERQVSVEKAKIERMRAESRQSSR